MRTEFAWLAVVLACVVLAARGVTADTRGLEPVLAEKLDPRLLRVALAPDAAPVAVWVALRDKGERSPADLAAALARAAVELSPECRARRNRAHVSPLVDYRDLPVHAPYLDALEAEGLKPYGASRWFNQVAVHVRGSQLAAIAALPFVQHIQRVDLGRRLPDLPPSSDAVSVTPPAQRYSASQTLVSYGMSAGMLGQIGVPAVHDSGYIGTGVLICVLDEGFNFFNKHEALRSPLIPVGRRRDFVDGDGDPTDTTSGCCFSHGAWTLGEMKANKFGTYVGAAYGAQFAIGRTENSFSEHQIEMVYWGMGAEWADSLGADIISSSLGYFSFDAPDPSYTYADMNGHTTIISRAAEIAASKGILVVNSMGNGGIGPPPTIIAPADVNGDSLIAVGAVDTFGIVAGFSSNGPTSDGRIKPDLAARGVSNALVSASGDPQGYTALSGTSFSCPLVAGLAACLMQARPTWSPQLIIRALRETASQATTPDNHLGHGIPNGLAALRWTPDTAGVPALSSDFLRLWLLGPNPLRSDGPSAVLRFALGAPAPPNARASVRVIDAAGRKVRDLWAGPLTRGAAITTSWDGRDNFGQVARSGLYFITLEAGGRRVAVRIASLR